MTKTTLEPPQEEIAVAYDEASKALSEWCVLTFYFILGCFFKKKIQAN